MADILTEMKYEVNLEKVAMPFLGISGRRYRQLASERIVPAVVKGVIDFMVASKNLIEYYRKLASSQGSLSLADERTRWTKIKADREELKKQVDIKSLVLKGEVESWLHGHIEETKMALLGLPRRMGPVFSPISDEKEIEFLLREEIHKILEEMAKPLHGKKQSRRKNSRRSKAMVATT